MNEAGMKTKQLELEKRMATLGKDKFRDNYERWTGADRAGDVKPVKTAMESAIAPLALAIDGFLQEAKSGRAGRRHSAVRLFDGLESPVLAFLTVKIVMDGLIRGQELTPLAVKVGSYIEVEKNLTDIKREVKGAAGFVDRLIKTSQQRNRRPEHFKVGLRYSLRRKFEGADALWEEWGISDRLLVGLKLIELLCQATGLFEVKPRRKGKQVTNIVVPTEHFDKWLEGLKGWYEVLFPEYLPCIIPPKDWNGLQDGGYHGEEFAYSINFVKTRSKQHIQALEAADLSPVFKAVNAMQRTPWSINTQVLDVAFYLMDLGTGLAGLPQRVLERPAKPHDIATNEEARKAWGMEAGRIIRRNIETKMQRLQAWKTIKIAQEFRKYDKIYFPYQLDFRGRIYSIPSHLTPQGTDLAKGLLHFGEGDAIRDGAARDWLAIHGANCFGLDKVPFKERLQWVETNKQRIIDTATEPLDDFFWLEADSPFCFLAFCFEWKAYLDHMARGEAFISRLPIAMDGSCNGLQHYSAMLRDPEGGRAVNLIPSDTPQDIYGAVANKVNEKLQAEDREEYQAWAKAWLDFGIDRKITKRPVMVLPYGGTFQACREYVGDSVYERGNLPFEQIETRRAINYLSGLVWHSIGEVVVSAKLAMKWLRQVARAFLEGGEAVQWVTPLGFPVVQHYSEKRNICINTNLFGKRYQPRIEIPRGDKPAKNPQLGGIAPNFVHSLDACVLMMTVNKAVDQGLSQFAMIHDSYGTTAAKTAQLANILREEFIRLYTDSRPLEQFEGALEEPPFVGGLDLRQLMNSPYFFA